MPTALDELVAKLLSGASHPNSSAELARELDPHVGNHDRAELKQIVRAAFKDVYKWERDLRASLRPFISSPSEPDE